MVVFDISSCMSVMMNLYRIRYRLSVIEYDGNQYARLYEDDEMLHDFPLSDDEARDLIRHLEEDSDSLQDIFLDYIMRLP